MRGRPTLRPGVIAGRRPRGWLAPCALVLLVCPGAMAAPTWAVDQHVDPYDGCEIWLGQADATGVAPVRAECTWPDADPHRMLAALRRYEEWGAFIPEIVEARIVGTANLRTLVWQYAVPGHHLAPREVQVWLESHAAGGVTTFSWTTAKEPYTPREGSVPMPRNAGFWTVSAAPGGGVTVVQELDIDPGGMVPHWLVHWFQTEGLARDMRCLHGYLLAGTMSCK